MTVFMTEAVRAQSRSPARESLKAFDSLLWGVALLDRERRLQYYNPEFTRFLCEQTGLKLAEDDLLDHTLTLDSLWDSEPEAPGSRWQVLTPNGKYTIVAERLDASSALQSQHCELHYMLQLQPVAAGQEIPGELANAITVGNSGNKEKLELLTSFSHEFRTPLNAVLGFSHLLLDDVQSKNQKQHVESIISAGSHLLKLVNEILALSKADYDCSEITLNTENVDVQKVVSECVSLLQPLVLQSNVTVEQSGNACFLICDRMRLKQIVLNLLSNAIKYNKPDGRVVVRTLAVGNRCSGLEVQDTGVGITAEACETIFNPFKRLLLQSGNCSSSGIGLMLTRRLVNVMGGRIRVGSKSGCGSVFAVDFNLDDELSGTAGLLNKSVIWMGRDSESRRFASDLLNQRNGVSMRCIEQLPMVIESADFDALNLIIISDELLADLSSEEAANLKRLLENHAVLGIASAQDPAACDELLKLGVKGILPNDFDPVGFLAELDRLLVQ